MNLLVLCQQLSRYCDDRRCWSWCWSGYRTGYGASAVGRNPGAKSDITSTMLLGQAVAETTGLYGFAVAIILMFVKPSETKKRCEDNRKEAYN